MSQIKTASRELDTHRCGSGIPIEEPCNKRSIVARLQSSLSPMSVYSRHPAQILRSSVVKPLFSVAAKKPSGLPVAGWSLPATALAAHSSCQIDTHCVPAMCTDCLAYKNSVRQKRAIESFSLVTLSWH